MVARLQPDRAARALRVAVINFNGQDAAVLGVGINVLEDMRGNASAISLASLRNEAQAAGEASPPIAREVSHLRHYLLWRLRTMAVVSSA